MDEKASNDWLVLQFKQPVDVHQFSIQFQGGFVARSFELSFLPSSSSSSSKKKTNHDLFVFHSRHESADNNSEQIFPLSSKTVTAPVNVVAMKVLFLESSDHYGRICIYHLKIDGKSSLSAENIAAEK